MDNKLTKSIENTLYYFGIFKYPLTIQQLHTYLPITANIEAVKEAVAVLKKEGKLFEKEANYFLKNDFGWLSRKVEGAEKARLQVIHAKKIARQIYQFPFVKSVSISGSLSKGYADNQSDFDFFIITTKNRLWICRTILHLFKKTQFLFGRQHLYCMNYFITDNNLTIEEQNLYTAYELLTLIGCEGSTSFNQLMSENPWVKNFLPNSTENKMIEKNDTTSFLKQVAETVLNSCFPESLNRYLMRLTDKRWRLKWTRKGYDMTQYDLAFKTRIDVSKNHKHNYQKYVLDKISNQKN